MRHKIIAVAKKVIIKAVEDALITIGIWPIEIIGIIISGWAASDHGYKMIWWAESYYSVRGFRG